MADSTVSIGADLSELRRELAKLPNLSTDAAQKTLIQIEKAVHKAEKAAKKASKDIAKANKAAAKQTVAAAKQTVAANREVSQSLEDMGDAAGETESTLRAVSGALGMISPEGESAINVIAELGGAFEGLTSGYRLLTGSSASLAGAAGVAAVGVAAIGTVAVVVANQTAEARAQMKEYRATIWDTDAATRALVQSQQALKLASGDVAGFVADLQLQTALLNGEISSVDLEAGKLGGTLADSLKPQLLSAGTALAANTLRIDDLRESIQSGRLSFEDYSQASLELDDALAATDGLEKNLEAVKRLKDEGSDAIAAYAQSKESHAKAEKKSTAATKSSTKAADDNAAAIKAAAKAAEDAAAAVAAAQEAAAGVVSGLTRHRLSEIEALAVAEEEAMAKLLETEVATQDQIQAIREEFALRRSEAEAAMYDAAEKARKAEIDAERDAAEEILDKRLEAIAKYEDASAKSAGYVMDIAGIIKDNALDQEGELTANQKNAALDAYRIEKAAAIAQAGINTGAAVMKGIAMFGPPPSPAGIAAIAAAALTGGINIAKIASVPAPKFHVGGMVGSDPSERQAVVRAGEYVTDQAQVANLGGREAIDQARGRAGGAGTTIILENQIRGRTQDRVFHQLESSGGAVTRATRSTRPALGVNPFGG